MTIEDNKTITKQDVIRIKLMGYSDLEISNMICCDILWCKKNLRFLRTSITNLDGTISQARLNMNTGEIKPFRYARDKL